jgi:hypothetical protein
MLGRPSWPTGARRRHARNHVDAPFRMAEDLLEAGVASSTRPTMSAFCRYQTWRRAYARLAERKTIRSVMARP